MNRHEREVDLEELARVSRRLGNNKELLRALFAAGQFEEVIDLCSGPLRGESYYGTLALARTLFILGDYPGALGEWERYPFEVWSERVRELSLGTSRTPKPVEAPLASASKHDCTASLVCLRETMGRGALDDEQNVFLSHPLIFRHAAQAFGGWRAALAVLDTRHSGDAGVSRLRKYFRTCFRPSTTPEEMEKRERIKRNPAFAADTREVLVALDEVYGLWKRGRFDEAAALSKGLFESNPFGSSMRSDRASAAYLRSLLLAERFEKFIEEMRSGPWWRWPDLRDDYLNILVLAEDKLRAVDIPYWRRRTKFTEDHPDQVREYLQARLDDYEAENGRDPLRHAIRANPGALYTMEEALQTLLRLDSGAFLQEITRRSAIRRHLGRIFKISEQHEFTSFVRQLLGESPVEAENLLRSFMGVPLRGEGWVSQREVLRILEKGFAPLQVQAEASPPFLGGLRYDVFVPELRLAVEYQGMQHYEPVEVFGGEDGLRRTRERDAAKARLSEQNGITLEYVRYDDEIGERCQRIIEKHRQA